MYASNACVGRKVDHTRSGRLDFKVLNKFTLLLVTTFVKDPRHAEEILGLKLAEITLKSCQTSFS